MNHKLMIAQTFLAEGCLLPYDRAMELMGLGFDVGAVERKIDGFSIIDPMYLSEEYDY